MTSTSIPRAHNSIKRGPSLSKALLLGLLFSFLFNGAFANDRLTIQFRNTQISKAFSVIEEKTPYHFVYNNRLPSLEKKVTVSFKDATLDEVLSGLLSGTGLTHQLTETKLVIIFEGSKNNSLAAPVTGKITDETGKPL